MKNQTAQTVRNLLPQINKAVVVSHFNPDGDAVGSTLAMYHYLEKLGLEVTAILPNMYPDFLGWMLRGEHLIVYTEKRKAAIESIIAEADIIFCVDFNAFHRTKLLADALASSTAYKVLIDHHIEPDTKAFNSLYSKIETSSTAELIYDFICDAGDKHLIDKSMAECIYVGMITDTGSFSYNCNYENSYMVLAHLFALGIDGAYIQRLVYNNFTENRMRLFGLCLSENLYVLHEHKTAYIVLTLDDLKKYSYQVGDTEGIVNYALAIKGIEMAALFIERKDLVRISFRSYDNLSVNALARTHFEGGGHKNAAGANSYLSLKDTIDKFKDILPTLDSFRERVL